MQEPLHGVSLEEVFSREPGFTVEEVPTAIVYSRRFAVTGRVVARAFSALSGSLVPAYEVNEFLLFVAPYVESLGTVYAFLDNEDDARRVDDLSRVLGVRVVKFAPGNVKGDVRLDEPLVLDSAVRSLKAIARRFPSKRSDTLLSSLNPEGITEFVKSKREEIGDREVLVSPVFFPANEVLGLKTVFDSPEKPEVAVVTSTADNLVARKKLFELLRSGRRAKEVVIDVDPVVAPIYLLLVFS